MTYYDSNCYFVIGETDVGDQNIFNKGREKEHTSVFLRFMSFFLFQKSNCLSYIGDFVTKFLNFLPALIVDDYVN